MLLYSNEESNFDILNLLYFSLFGLWAIFDITVYIDLKTFLEISKLSISANKMHKSLLTIFCKLLFPCI